MEYLFTIIVILGGLSVALGLQSNKCCLANWIVGFVLSAIFGCLLSKVTFYATSIVIFLAVNCIVFYETKNIAYSITISSLTLIVVMLADSIFPAICILVEKRDINDILFGYRYSYILYILAVVIISIVMGALLGKLFNKKMKMSEALFSDQLGKLSAILSLLSVALIFINNYLGRKFGFNNDFIIVNGFFVTVFSVIIITVVIALLQNMVIKMEFMHNAELADNLLAYTKDLELICKNMREFRHDYKNILFSMSTYINNNDYGALKEYFFDKIYPMKNSLDENVVSAEAISKIQIKEVQGILTIKQIYAISHKIGFYINVDYPINNISMDIIDLVRIIGILLDNAIEAARVTKNPVVNVVFIKNDGFEKIIVKNSCKQSNVQFDKMFDYGYSTKAENQGIGLSSYVSIINKYKNITYDFSCNNNIFKVEITICNVGKK